jgi:hypothetical protein
MRGNRHNKEADHDVLQVLLSGPRNGKLPNLQGWAGRSLASHLLHEERHASSGAKETVTRAS